MVSSQQLRQEGIGLQQPATLGDTVGFIIKTFRPELKEIWHQGSLDQFSMER